MPKKKSSTWVDPDDAPELTGDMMRKAKWFAGDRPVKRGRPKLDNPKEQITIRLDADVVRAIRKTGPGWTGKVNSILASSVKSGQFAKIKA
jgi:uncharacterized protein (DUF4415 family)